MSGRARHLRDGVLITNRKTARRQSPRRPLIERLHELNGRQAKRAPSGWDVRMAFLLPPTLHGFVTSGPHGTGVTVLKDFVQISGCSAEECFKRASNFFAAIARDRQAFTRQASIISISRPGEHYGRHLTVVRGALVVSAGQIEPKVFEAAA